MCLVAIIDWHSKAIVSYKLSNSMHASLITDVLKDVLNKYMDKYNNQRLHSSIGYKKLINVYLNYLQKAA